MTTCRPRAGGRLSRLTSFVIRNPHSYQEIEVTDKSGKTMRWAAELGSATEMSQAGIIGSTFRVGDYVTLTGPPSTTANTPNRLLARSVVRPVYNGSWSVDTKR